MAPPNNHDPYTPSPFEPPSPFDAAQMYTARATDWSDSDEEPGAATAYIDLLPPLPGFGDSNTAETWRRAFSPLRSETEMDDTDKGSRVDDMQGQQRKGSLRGQPQNPSEVLNDINVRTRTGATRRKRSSSEFSVKDDKVLKHRKFGEDRRESSAKRKPLSTNKNAVDKRARLQVEARYQARLEGLLSPEIKQRVDDEGGITPLGRLFKAVVMQLEQQQQVSEGTGGVSRQGRVDDGAQSVRKSRTIGKEVNNAVAVETLRQENERLKERLRLVRQVVSEES